MNLKKVVLASVALAILWCVMDFVIHGVLLAGQYMATAQLWRPMEEMSYVMNWGTIFVCAVLFVLFYNNVTQVKTVEQGTKFGFWYGLLAGVAMFSITIYMPVPQEIGIAWFFAGLSEAVAGGALVGYLLR